MPKGATTNARSGARNGGERGGISGVGYAVRIRPMQMLGIRILQAEAEKGTRCLVACSILALYHWDSPAASPSVSSLTNARCPPRLHRPGRV